MKKRVISKASLTLIDFIIIIIWLSLMIKVKVVYNLSVWIYALVVTTLIEVSRKILMHFFSTDESN